MILIRAQWVDHDRRLLSIMSIVPIFVPIFHLLFRWLSVSVRVYVYTSLYYMSESQIQFYSITNDSRSNVGGAVLQKVINENDK